MLKNYYKLFIYILRKIIASLIGIVAIATALFSDIPKAFEIFLLIALPILVAALFWEVKSIYKNLREKHIPLLVSAGKSDEKHKSMVSEVLQAMKEYRFEEKAFEEDFDIDRYMWIIRRESDLSENPQEWMKLVRDFERKIQKLSAKLKGRRVFHIFLNCPAALATGLGAVLGTRYEVVLHHYQKGIGPNPYHPVIDFYSKSGPEGVRIIMSRVKPPNQYIKIEEPETLLSTVLVSLYLAGHDPKGHVEKFAKKRMIPAVHIRSKMEGTLPINADWLRATREVTTYLLNISRREIESIEVFMSTPIVIAFVVGMALGTKAPFLIHNWFPETKEYHLVLELNKLGKRR